MNIIFNQFNRIDEAIESIANSFPETLALQIWESENYKSITYAELNKAMQQGADLLRKQGIRPGDRVVLLGETRRIEWTVAYLAIQKIQATAAILDASLTSTDLINLIQYCDAEAILTVPEFVALVPLEPAMIVLNYLNSFQFFSNTIIPSPITRKSSLDNDPSISALLFTSGTTYKPKAVMLTHRNILHVAFQCIQFTNSKREQILGILPLHHSFGLGILIMTFLMGGTLTFVEKLQGDIILKTMQRSQTTLLIATPRLLEAIYKNIKQTVRAKGMIARGLFNFLSFLAMALRTIGFKNPGRILFRSLHKKFGSRLIHIVSGASPLPIKISEKIEQWGWIVLEGYGLTETSGAISCNKPNKRCAGTVGLVIGESQVKISYPNVHGEGEICYKGPNLMLGYFRDPQATQHAIREGWFHTGDLGYFNKDGMLKVTGRIKEMIVAASGKKIMPDDVEQRYYEIPGIQEIAVVPIRPLGHPYDEIHAAIVLENSLSKLSAKEKYHYIKNALSNRAASVPSYMRIQHFHFVNELPKTTTFKVKRVELKKMLESRFYSIKTDQHSNIQFEASDSVNKRLYAILAQEIQHCNAQIKSQDSLQFDLGIDSINRIQIAANIKNEFMINFDDKIFFTIDKVDDIVNLIKNSLSQTNNFQSKIKYHSPPIRSLENKFFFGLFNTLSRIVWKFETQGLEYLPKHSSFILCSNHVTNLDLLLVASCLNSKDRLKLCCFAKQDIFSNWFFGYLAQICHAIPIDRFGDFNPALHAGMEILKEGRNLLINPEGTRSIDGQLGPFRKGASFLAKQTGVPLIPVKIIGGYEIFPPHLKFPRLFNWAHFRRYRLSIIFGEPLIATQEEDEESLIHRLKLSIENLTT